MASHPSNHHLKAPARNSTAHTTSDHLADGTTRAALHPHDPAQPDGGVNARPADSPNAPVTAALSTPHDAILAELHDVRDGSDHLQAKLGVVPSVGSLERTERTTSPSAGARSATSTPGVTHEPLLDPFSGNVVGVMVSKKDSADRDQAALQFDQRRDELWGRLASIRELQSKVASMHVQMEGIGLNELRGGKRAAGAAGRVHPEAIPVAEEWDEPDSAADAVEEQRKRARDAEFTNLAETFKGRREAIDAIMNKVCVLD